MDMKNKMDKRYVNFKKQDYGNDSRMEKEKHFFIFSINSVYVVVLLCCTDRFHNINYVMENNHIS